MAEKVKKYGNDVMTPLATSCHSVTLWRKKVKKYGNDVMTPLATSCHSVNKSCASYDSHNVVNLKFHVIFS